MGGGGGEGEGRWVGEVGWGGGVEVVGWVLCGCLGVEWGGGGEVGGGEGGWWWGGWDGVGWGMFIRFDKLRDVY